MDTSLMFWSQKIGSVGKFNNSGALQLNYKLSLKSGNYFTSLQSGVLSSNINFTLPPDYGTNGQFLMSNGAGALSWGTSSGGIPSLTASYIGYGDGSNLITGSSTFTFDGSSLSLSGLTIGQGAGNILSNIAIGPGTLTSKTGTGIGNICIGRNAGAGITAGEVSTIIGYHAGTVGAFDVATFYGARAGEFATAGTTAFGADAGNKNSNTGNTYLGKEAGKDNTNAGECTFIGEGCGYGTAGGYGSTFIGSGAALGATGNYNTFLGRHTGRFTNGSNLTILGANIDPQVVINDAVLIGTGDGHIRFKSLSDGDFRIQYDDATYSTQTVSSAGLVTNTTTGANFTYLKPIGIGAAPAASAALQVTSTTQGFLPPSMTGLQAEAISSPATGLMIFANNGNGSTINSIGWWGWTGSTWYKF